MKKPDPSKRAIWLRYHRQKVPSRRRASPEINDLAAFIQGTASPGIVDRIEHWIAQTPGACQELRALSRLYEAELIAPPPDLKKRAKALNPALSNRAGSSRVVRLDAHGFRRAGSWAAAIAACLVFVLAGSYIGRQTRRDLDRISQRIMDTLVFGVAEDHPEY